MDEFVHHPLKLKQIFFRGALAAALLTLNACSRPAADFTLTLGGDIMLAREGKPLFETQGQEINPWSELQQKGVLINDDSSVLDYFLVNLESPLGEYPPDVSDMNLCSNPLQVKMLTTGGVDLVSLANNHRDDCEINGTDLTKSYLDEANIHSSSMGAAPTYIEIPGGRLAVISAEDISGLLDVDALITEINNAQQQAQVVVVSMHWGNEYQAGADERQQTLAQQIADAGADVIWGHHPHVLQKMEWLESTDGRQVLALYSLGNLLADQWMLEDAQQSALVRLYFRDNKINGIEVIPLEIDQTTKTIQIAEGTHLRENIFVRLTGSLTTREGMKIQLLPETR
ncbi:MAG TPA: hypothetical protein DIW44_04840 [Anaerolineaceae bacterium]|nr:hypothetical protein [Anaerolineaceae bacterium]